MAVQLLTLLPCAQVLWVGVDGAVGSSAPSPLSCTRTRLSQLLHGAGQAWLGPRGSCFGLAGTQRRLTALWGTALQLVPRWEWAQGSPGSRLPQAAPYEAKSSREAASPRALHVPRHPTHCVGAELLSPAASCIRDQTHRSFTDPGQGAVHLAVMAGAGRAVRCSAVLPREGNERAKGGFWLRHLVLQTQTQAQV